MKFDEVLENRFCCRDFQEKEIEPEKIQTILESANSAPSAGNLQAYHIFAVSNKDRKSELARAALNQMFIAEAPLVLVFCSNNQKSALEYGERGRTLYALQDATIAAVFAWLKAVDLGLSACWVGAFDDEKVKEILDAEKNLRPVVIMPIGYCGEGKEERQREKIEKHFSTIN